LDRVARVDVPVNLAVHDDRAAGDLGGDLGGLPDDQTPGRGDLAREGAVDTDLTLEAQLALDDEPRTEQRLDPRVACLSPEILHPLYSLSFSRCGERGEASYRYGVAAARSGPCRRRS